MRRRTLGVAISVIVHAGVLAYVALFVLPGARRVAPTPREVISVPLRTAASAATPAPEPLAMEVTLLDDTPPGAVSAQPAPPSSAPSQATAAAIARTAPAAHAGPAELPAAIAPGVLDAPDAEHAAGSDAPHGHSKSLLVMRHSEAPSVALPAVRHPAAPSLALPAGMFDALDHVPRAATPAGSTGAGVLDNDGAGNELGQGMFDAKVAADGTVKLTDKHSVRVALALEQALDDYLKSDNTLGGPAGDPAIASTYQLAPGTAINLGASSVSNALPTSASLSHNLDRKGTTVVVPLIGGKFDATDVLMRRHGMDPYLARKLKFLDATRDARVQLGKLNRAEQLAHATELMDRNLAALWMDPRLDLAARKRALFELWDECAEDGDAILVHGAGDARQLVIDFIRGHVPAGSAGAYTRSDLAELARHQQSRAVFQPYDE